MEYLANSNLMVGATGVEPVQTYLYAGDLQSPELTSAQHTQILIAQTKATSGIVQARHQSHFRVGQHESNVHGFLIRKSR